MALPKKWLQQFWPRSQVGLPMGRGLSQESTPSPPTGCHPLLAFR
jgi:hypothetical protein